MRREEDKMPDSPANSNELNTGGIVLEISLRAVPSTLQISGGKIITFSRAILAVRNTSPVKADMFELHATVGQEGGSVQDLTEALSKSRHMESIPPGETVEWDVYDLLLPAHPGVASKVHMFGYRAVLDWWFDLTAWVEYRSPDAPAASQTPAYNWKLRWSRRDPLSDNVDVYIEAVKN
jgi:hypothetical protein